MVRDRLDDAQLAQARADLPAWDVSSEALFRVFRFPDFVTAFGFMASSALVAERLDHHPEWSNVYGTVEVRLTTHDRDGVTGLDLELAHAMDQLATGAA